MREIIIRKYVRIIWICLLIVALQVSSISAVPATYAASGNDVTNQVASDFITGVDIKEKTGSTIGNTLIGKTNIEKTTDFWLLYNFMVPNVHSILEGDYILLDVPPAIALPQVSGSTELHFTTLMIDEDNTPVAEAYLIAGNKIRLVFTDSVETLSNVGGAFFIAGGFDQSKIKTDGSETEIAFGIPQETLKLTFKADPIPEPDPVTVQKDGTITSGTSIEWKITINKENVSVKNAVLVDVISSSQSLDQTSIKVNNVAAPAADVSFQNGTLNLSLGDITTKQEITFVTSLTEDALLAALEEGKTSISVINDAALKHGDGKTTNADQPKTVPIPLNILSKSGNYLSPTTANNTKNMKWTIVVNSDKLKFDNAVIKDTLPAGLTFIAGSQTVTGASGVTPVVSGSDITFNLGNITDEVMITYETEIAPSYFQKNGSYNFNNNAVLTWTGLTGTGVAKQGNVGVGSSLFVKSGAGYNRSNGVISWSISINNEKINLAAPTITDTIPADQKFIEGSAKIVDDQGNVYSGGGAFSYNAATKTLSYIFNSTISSKYTITFDTKPVSTELITANQSGQFSNTATFKSGSITVNSTGTQSYSSNVFKKEQAGYDLAARIIKWKFTVNENGATTPSSNSAAIDPSLYNAIPLANVSIHDAIPAGLKFLPNKTKVFDRNGNPVSGIITTQGSGPSGYDEVTFKFTSNITEKYTIEIETEIIDESKFTSQGNALINGNFNVKNEATLTHNESTKTNKSEATQEIKNRIVSKKGIPTAYGNKYIDWVVYLNSNAVNLNQLLAVDKFWLIDNLQAGLELDTTSVALLAYDRAIEVPNSIPADGNDGLGAGRNITLDGTHIKYDATTREFRLNFPGDSITTAYKLSFRTYVTESVSSGAQFSNGISLYGSKSGTPVSIENAYQSNDSRQVTFLEAGSVGYGNLGKFVVNKVDLENTSKKLSGATFALYDRFGNKVQEKTTVNGQLEFNRIKSDLSYYIKEAVAPVGYLLSGNVSVDGNSAALTTAVDVVQDAVEVKLNSVTNQKSVEVTFKNQEIKANVQFVKQNDSNGSLAGAKFGLFARGASASSTPLATATSTSTGIVSFTNVPYGQYDIREMEAPFGYRTLTGVVHAVEVTATDHGKTLQYAAVSNEKIKANLKFVKKNGTGTGIAGAEFSLYNSANQFVAKETSGAGGIVEFKNVQAGDYTIVETAAPFGYVPLSGVVKTAKIEEAQHGTTIDLGDVTNVRIQASIAFMKADENNQALPGATFGLYDGSDTLVQSQISQADGKVTFTNIGQGTYTLKEISAPYGYLPIAGVIYNVTVTANDHNKTIPLNPVVNTLIEANIKFVKVGETGQALPGAKFGLYSRGAAAGSTPIDTATSDNSGVVLFANVPYGNYDIREIEAPYGYRTLTGVVHEVGVTVTDHGKTLNPSAVSNELIRANIKFVKLDNSGGKLAGAEFTLYNSGNQAVATSESDVDGIVEFKNILAGSYTVRETKAPFGYLPLLGDVGTATITEAKHGTTITLADVTNEWIQSGIQFVKTNENSQPLAGAKFGLYNGQNALVQAQVSQSDGKVTFTHVDEGSYTIKEISAPYGYLLNNDVIYNVTITANDHNKTIALNSVANTLIEANMEFVKVSEKGRPLAGAEFELLDSNGGVVQTVTSGTDGKVTFVDVREGEYVIREKTAPVGYNPLAGDVATVEINAQKHNTTVTIPDVTNQIIRGDVEFVKVAKFTGQPLMKASFALYAADDTAFNTEIATAVSDHNGVVRFEDVEYGDYTIVEIVSPSGYYRSKEKLSVSVREEGKTYQLGNFENQLIPDDVIEGVIEILKVNELDAPLAGARFALYDAFGNFVAEAVSNNSGIARFAPVYAGEYTVKEAEAPKNYVKSDQVSKAAIDRNQNYVKLTFVNERSSDAPWPSVSVRKVDDTGAKLAGVTFALYKATDTTFTTPIAKSTTNADGVATFTNIRPGKYVVKEMEALEGYMLSNVTLPVTVTEDVQTFNAGTVENRVIRGAIVVTKVNELNEPLQGAEFGLYDENGKLVKAAVSNSEGIASFKDIPYGSYNLKELAAPESYQKSDDAIEIKITVDGKAQAYTIVNKKANGSSDDNDGNSDDTNGEAGTDTGTVTDTGTDQSENSGLVLGVGSNNQGNNGTDEKGDKVSGAHQSNELPKTGDSVSTMIWLFIGSGLLILAFLLVGRRTQKQ
ncbi:SpaA isopeptide-forming pilin-related protein [Paenibacillus contaminans]|uniref:Gram-positive cocci surface proteins LPxTG domain-containing protein n=1 Tax=Paenibacillus contaminans TaxID=450362 RepID=A0A329M1Q8_9BACL|nr:SpaA isopeptide-forming pilin-related protein [Paenibacillus contaminans]RAV13834.1 hypothetical protein DQG23_32645 [Paenibacillus contaminans]